VFVEEISGSRRYSKDYQKKKKTQLSHKTGAWNVRTMHRGGKLENLKREMQYEVGEERTNR